MTDRPSITEIDPSQWVSTLPLEPRERMQDPKSDGSGFILKLLYDADDELLYVTKNPNEQTIIKEEWFKRVTYAKYYHYSSRDELSKAKIKAIQQGQPKWNSRVTG